MAGSYETPNVALGAYLLTQGYTLRRSYAKETKVWFEFNLVNGREIEYDVADFFSGKGKVVAQEYNEATFKLSGVIRDVKRENGNGRR